MVNDGITSSQDHSRFAIRNAGLINPAQRGHADFRHAVERFETGLPVEGMGASHPMGIQSNHMLGSISPISRGDMFAAGNELRSDNRF